MYKIGQNEENLSATYEDIFSKHKTIDKRQQAVDDALKKLYMEGELKFYHGSKDKTIKELTPKAIGIRDSKEGPVVFTTNFRAISSMFIMDLRDGNQIMNFELGQTPFVIFRNAQLIIDNDNGGMVYECKPNSNDFHVDLSKGWGINECVSKGNVDIINRHEVRYAIREIADSGVDIYIAGDEIFDYIESFRVSSRIIPSAKKIMYNDRFEETFGGIKNDRKKIEEKIRELAGKRINEFRMFTLQRFTAKDEKYLDEFIESVAEVISRAENLEAVIRVDIEGNVNVSKRVTIPDEIQKKYEDRFSVFVGMMDSIAKGETIDIDRKPVDFRREFKVEKSALQTIERAIDARRMSRRMLL